ncbi:MAG: acyltransferase family protein [Acidobacteriota bacterium]
MGNAKSERLLSLDVFRGITIAGMILVNNPGSWDYVYPALEHAKWNGITPTDLIFPFFLFIVGVATTLSLSKRKQRGDDQKKLALQILRRAVIIFLLGLLMAAFPNFNFATVRIPGVLARIAVVYLITSLIYLKANTRTLTILSAVILLLYWAIMTLIPVPGVGYANLEPSTNLGAWLDRMIFGRHIWYYSKTWDPEGLLSTLPAISTAIFGILTGEWLRRSDIENSTRTVWMFFWGNVGLLLGTIWDMWFPINKNLWTSSYVVFTAGMALQFLAMCYWLIDVKGYTKWTKPFVVYGMNAIAVYFLSGIVARALYMPKVTDAAGNLIDLRVYIYNVLFASWLPGLNASLAWAIMYVLFWLGVMWIFYTKKIFIKV